MEGCLSAAKGAGAEEGPLVAAWGTIRANTIAQQIFRCASLTSRIAFHVALTDRFSLACL